MSDFIKDCVVVVAYFVAIISIGLAQRSKSRSVEGFALGNRNIAWWAVLASIIAAEISAATFLGAPGEGYEKLNWTYAQLAIGTVLARIFVSFVFIPIFYKQGVVSIYEFLGERFGGKTRAFASFTFLITRILGILSQEYTIWTAFIGSTFVTMATHGIYQDTVQRMLTAKNRNQSAFATIMSGIFDLPIAAACFLIPSCRCLAASERET
jgi:Na+/proline symporter